MIDEEKARLEEAAQMTVEQKVVVLDQHVECGRTVHWFLSFL